MKPDQRTKWVFGLLLAAWLLVVAWQVEEHQSVVETAKANLRIRSREIVNTLSAVTHALQFHGGLLQDKLEPVLKELVDSRNSALVKLIYISLLNTDGDSIISVGKTNLISREVLAESEVWSDNYVTFVMPLEGASVSAEGVTNNPPFVLPRFPNGTNDGPREFSRRRPRDYDTNAAGGFPPFTNAAGEIQPPPNGDHPPDDGNRPRGGNRRPPRMFGMSEADFKIFIAHRELHGLVLAMSTDNYRAVCTNDWWLRLVIVFFAGISALGAGLAWRNTARTADLQIRLVRASELNLHLKEMNLAAAGLAHETRNPLNIIRGHAQMISRLPDTSSAVREQSKTIVDQTDRVTAQLTEFINYSRPREVRRTKIDLSAALAEIIRTLKFDIEEKKLTVETGGETLAVEADEQLLRQILFNLLLNAIQAAEENGQIQFVTKRVNAAEAALDIRDNGPGVLPQNRTEIFKPYFTTHQKGTGLGLAVVQQNVLAHGWEIVCLANEPRGAVFRITHLKIAG
jgi:signal transduction histidine kinase